MKGQFASLPEWCHTTQLADSWFVQLALGIPSLPLSAGITGGSATCPPGISVGYVGARTPVLMSVQEGI